MAYIDEDALAALKEILGQNRTAQVCPVKGGGVRVMVLSRETVYNAEKAVDKSRKMC